MNITKKDFDKILNKWDMVSLSYDISKSQCLIYLNTDKKEKYGKNQKNLYNVSYDDYINLNKWLIEWHENKPKVSYIEQLKEIMNNINEFEDKSNFTVLLGNAILELNNKFENEKNESSNLHGWNYR